MDKIDYRAVAEFAKMSTRGISCQQFGEMKLDEKDRRCDLVITYTKAPRFEEGVTPLSMSICFRNAQEASHARDILRHGSADLGADPVVERGFGVRRDPSFMVDL